MKINPVNKTNFSALPLAKVSVEGLDLKYRLFNITKSDKNFLRHWYASLELDKLMHNLRVEDYIIWDGVIESAIETSSDKGKKSILETCNDKICGILTYFKDIDRYRVNFASTVPIEKNKRTPFAGQILFNTFFKTFLKDFYYTVQLEAIKDTPFDSVKFYHQLGFKTFAENNYVKAMSIHRPTIIECVNAQDEFISTTAAKSRKNVDLYKIVKFPKPSGENLNGYLI